MTPPYELLHNLVLTNPRISPERDAISLKDHTLDYARLQSLTRKVSAGLLNSGLLKQERVAVYLPKNVENVVSMFATSASGGVFVPVNPILKAEQVAHILVDCNVRILITSKDRARILAPVLTTCPDLRTIVLIDGEDSGEPDFASHSVISWAALCNGGDEFTPHRVIDADMAAILYTSGSTGKPKGVVLSHLNMVTGAKSVAQYLENSPDDRILAVLPFSFDVGFSQLSTAFLSGARAVLMDYLLPRDVIKMAATKRITGLAGVPPLWNQLAQLDWPQEAVENLRYITNTGGAMPRATLDLLRDKLPKTSPYLMYGLTEAFRSTYLPPVQLDKRPDSIGKAIPNAEIMVVRPDGTPCDPDEPGELVHRGSLVAKCYWNDPEKTAERFKPAPGQDAALVIPEIAAWSGDTVRMDDEGYLYFIGRRDDMIKTSGYRISPSELEDTILLTGLAVEASAIGIPHDQLGQAIVIVAVPAENSDEPTDALLQICREKLPNFMVPSKIIWRDTLPRNPNGKLDRKVLVAEFQSLFEGDL